MIARPFSILTRILHFLLLLAVLHQLIGSTFMEGPKPGLPEDPLYEFHQWGGLTGLGLVSLFWLWTLVRRAETSLGALVPWFSATRRAALWTDLRLHGRALIRFRLPDDRLGVLASAIHGLGLLTVTTMAATVLQAWSRRLVWRSRSSSFTSSWQISCGLILLPMRALRSFTTLAAAT